MTPEEIEQLEAKRKEREDELILLLLLLIGYAVGRADGSVEVFRQTVGPRAATEIAESMADAHADSFPIYGARAVPDREELRRLYAPTGAEASEAMLDTIAQAIVAAGGDVSLGLRTAGYSRANANGLELGAERNIVTASNAGLLAAAFTFRGEARVTGLEHLSVIDEATTDICRPRNGVRLPVSHAYWRSNWPSLHWRCRSVLVPLTGEFQASERLPTVPPLAGFGRAPSVVLQMLGRLGGESRDAAA